MGNGIQSHARAHVSQLVGGVVVAAAVDDFKNSEYTITDSVSATVRHIPHYTLTGNEQSSLHNKSADYLD